MITQPSSTDDSLNEKAREEVWNAGYREKLVAQNRQYVGSIASRLRALAKKSGMPEIALSSILDDVRGDVVQAFNAEGRIVVLTGPRNSGKTTAAGVWVWHWLSDIENWTTGSDPVFRKGAFLFLSAAELFRLDRFKTMEMHPVLNCQRLIIDDLGDEYMDSGNTRGQTLGEILATRCDHNRPTLMTSRLARKGLENRYGENFEHRLNKHGRVIELKKIGPQCP